MKVDPYPSQEVKLAAFLQNLVDHIDAATAEMGLPKDTFQAMKDAAQAWLDAHQIRVDAEKGFQTALKKFQDQQPLTEKAVRAGIKQIKNTVNVPISVLEDLELTSSGDTTQERVAAQMPVLVATVELGVVNVRYKKLGHQGIRVYSCRSGETDFTLLGTFTLNKFTDTRSNRTPGQPEQRDYYAVYVDKDQPVGEQSATVSIVVGSRPGQ